MSPVQLAVTDSEAVRDRPPVTLWLLLSLGLHLLLLLWWVTPTLPVLVQRSLSVTLVTPEGNEDTRHTHHNQKRRPITPEAIAKAASTPNRNTADTTPTAVAAKQAATSTTSNMPPAVSQGMATQPLQATTTTPQDETQTLLLKLQLALAQYFHYPAMAQRHGWQGEVLLSFRLERDGRILDARIAHSSGYSLLDRAALSSLQQVGAISVNRLPVARQLELPVIYRLQEG